MRLEGKTAIIIGAGQTTGEGLGNGRATALRFAQEGARIMAVNRSLPSAEETALMVKKQGGECFAFQADVTKEATLAAAIVTAQKRWGHIDILHYNVGVGVSGGDAPLLEITEEAFDRVCASNLRGAIMACKHVIPIMRQQKSGVIVMMSSLAALATYPYVGYKTTKAAMIALTKQVAIENAEYGIRANAIILGSVYTPHAVAARTRLSGKSSGQIEEEVAEEKFAHIPLRHKMGTAWDAANAALFLASDEANFITGAALPVDGGSSINIPLR